MDGVANCPAGYTVIGGGIDIVAGTADNVNVTHSHPDGFTAWRAGAASADINGSNTVTVMAVCIPD